MTADPAEHPAASEASADQLSARERATLAVLGLLALAAAGVLAWQRRPAALVISRPPSPEAAAWDEALSASRQVDVNTAGVAELERLPGVGPALAGRIVAEREQRGPFQSAEDLARVRGLGPKTIEAVKDYVTMAGD